MQFELLLHLYMISHLKLILLKLLFIFFWRQIQRLEGGG